MSRQFWLQNVGGNNVEYESEWQITYHVIPFSFKIFCANKLPNLAAIFKS